MSLFDPLVFDALIFDAESGPAPALGGVKPAGTFGGAPRPPFHVSGRMAFASRWRRPFSRSAS
jgi:hypothetical protein